MIFAENIPRQLLQKIRGKRWYRHGVYRSSLLQACFIVLYHDKKWYKKEGIDVGLGNLLQRGDESFIDEGEYGEIVKYFQGKINPAFLEKYIRRYNRDNERILDLSRKIDKLDPRKLSNLELSNGLESFFKKSRGLVHWLWSMEFLNPAIDEYLRERLKEDEIFYISHISQKLAFQKEKEEIASLKKITERKIQHLYSKYDWLNMNFWSGRPMTISEYEKRVKKIFLERDSINIKKKEESDIIRKADAFIDNLADDSLRKMIRLTQELIYLKTERIDVFTISWRNIFNLVSEVLKRLKISLEEMHMLSENEIIGLLKGRDVEINKKKRENFIALRLNHENYYFYGKAYEVISKYLNKVRKEEKNILYGQSGYKGHVKGRVKVIMNDRELYRVEKGDILVSNLTNPNYDSIFSKLSAVITDEGGLLCHSAIMAREFKIPCIIGTKIATQTFKDGDLVEVDADKGVIRLLERNK